MKRLDCSMSWVGDLASLDMDGSGRRGDLSCPRANSSCGSGPFSNLPGINSTHSVVGTGARAEDFPRIKGFLVLREADTDGVRVQYPIPANPLVCAFFCHTCVSWSALPLHVWNSWKAYQTSSVCHAYVHDSLPPN